jgi:hypothetical protein
LTQSRSAAGRDHVGHRAAGSQVRQDDVLVRRTKNVRAFRHEVHTAEHDVVGLGPRGDLARQLERVTRVVGELDDLVALVMVAENHQPAAELPARLGNTDLHFGVGKAEVLLRQSLAFSDVFLLELGQQRND